ncbi:zinc-binding dehydrogenase [Bacillota bacterium Meth-B3]|nr:alcohol dehydrogenase catalytic domain-containing protein [Christensenellaceae bacterium]MEA5064799.1 alcohol dehydrogenase catalytic domain-containing protein [Eubacteriales bacterium]
MKSLRFLGPKVLEVQDVGAPAPGAGEVLIKVRACGICGSDVHGWLGKTGRRIPPMTMGHEFAGEIAAVGAGVDAWKAGDGVVVQPINFCGECVNCRGGMTNMCLNKKFFGVLTVDGAMAEYVAVPQKLLYRLPEGCSYETGAMAEPYAVAYGSVAKCGGIAGKDVLIVGAGMIGLCILQMVKLHNPKSVTVADLSDRRLKKALDLGADFVINSAKEDALARIADCTDGLMMDLSIEAVGVEPTANLSVKALKVAGTAVWVGMSQREMQINMQDIVCSARSVVGSFNYTHEEFGEVVALLGSGRLATGELLSRVVTLPEAPQAFRDLLENPDDLLKIVIDPSK